MQIEVVDDHSTKDDPEAVVKELAGDRIFNHEKRTVKNNLPKDYHRQSSQT